MAANEKALFNPEEQILKGQREYYNLDLEEHKYLLQMERKLNGEKPNRQLDNLAVEPFENYYFSEVFNIAFGGNTTLNQLFTALRDNLAKFDEKINDIEPEYGSFRVGDIPHSQASILKAKTILEYEPEYDASKGFELAAEWYYKNLK